MTFLVRQTFAKMFGQSPDDLDMHVVYDVSHNIAKVEQHYVDGKHMRLLVHRKGRDCFMTLFTNYPDAILLHSQVSRLTVCVYSRVHQSLRTAPPIDPRGLPTDRAAGADRRHHGNVLVRAHRHRQGHD